MVIDLLLFYLIKQRSQILLFPRKLQIPLIEQIIILVTSNDYRTSGIVNDLGDVVPVFRVDLEKCLILLFDARVHTDGPGRRYHDTFWSVGIVGHLFDRLHRCIHEVLAHRKGGLIFVDLVKVGLVFEIDALLLSGYATALR